MKICHGQRARTRSVSALKALRALLHNGYGTNKQSFSTAAADGLYIFGGRGWRLQGLLPADAKVSNTTIQNINTLLGVLTKNQLDLNYNLQGQTLPLGATVVRNFGEKHFDLYGQDS